MILAHIQSNVDLLSFLASSQARVEPMTPILCPPPTPNGKVNASMHHVHHHTTTAYLRGVTSACYVG
ncbi:hypothetical protein BDM02DRAFT_3119124 [Thelephora ganbajun]|uniref:Uncharacterized protein n=1 Tax=Thelephora ganbajun TaxID=370292 RepID=A0ACB6Z8S5_THEGA|nr:hypothetical protein BDM02DRAFT_3119124 [Thelephora ganbajun]